MEVEGDYCYRVGEQGLLVHNVSDIDPGIFRAMVEDNGQPKLGSSATTLGVRKGKDIDVDTNDMVKRPTFRPGQRNGVSCSPTIKQLPAFVLPV
jgi:hypothetical protein